MQVYVGTIGAYPYASLVGIESIQDVQDIDIIHDRNILASVDMERFKFWMQFFPENYYNAKTMELTVDEYDCKKGLLWMKAKNPSDSLADVPLGSEGILQRFHPSLTLCAKTGCPLMVLESEDMTPKVCGILLISREKRTSFVFVPGWIFMEKFQKQRIFK